MTLTPACDLMILVEFLEYTDKEIRQWVASNKCIRYSLECVYRATNRPCGWAFLYVCEPDSDSAYDLVCDKVECLNVLMEGEATTADVVRKIEKIFSDTDSTNVVMCSTVHKAKGLERPVVWVLVDTFRRGFSDEEDNVWYVAVTRSQDTLMLVSGE